MDSKYYHFRAAIEDVGTPAMRTAVIFLPPAIAKQLPFAKQKRLRLEGEINAEPVIGAWQPLRGRWFFMVSKKLMKRLEVLVGDVVEMEFRVADPEDVQTPMELLEALQAKPQLHTRWNQLSAGKRRALAYRVAGAKSTTVRARRVTETLKLLRTKKDPSVSDIYLFFKSLSKLSTKTKNKRKTKDAN